MCFNWIKLYEKPFLLFQHLRGSWLHDFNAQNTLQKGTHPASERCAIHPKLTQQLISSDMAPRMPEGCGPQVIIGQLQDLLQHLEQ